MKLVLSSILLTFLTTAAAAESDLTLWYTKPATNWNEALPLGNGRLWGNGVRRRAARACALQ